MKKNKPQNRITESGALVHFSAYEDTVIRDDDSKKLELGKKLRQKRTFKTARQIITIVSVFAFLVSGFFLAKRGIEKYMAYSAEKTNETDKLSDDMVEQLDSMTEEEAWAYLYKQYPDLMDVNFPAGMNYEYALHYAQNPEMIGYLKIDGTRIDTPVAKADNNKYYLTHDFYGKLTSYGAVYASYIDDFKPFDRNTLLYGHNMKDGSRFAALTNYKSLDYFKEHPVIEFNTLFEKHKWKIYAVIVTNGDINGDDGYFFDFTFDNCSDTCFAKYVLELDKRKLYNTGVDLLPDDKLLTLCTCTYDFDNARLIVIGRMVREGESETVDTSLATYKTTAIKYPSSYYSNPQKNPYKDDERWYLY